MRHTNTATIPPPRAGSVRPALTRSSEGEGIFEQFFQHMHVGVAHVSLDGRYLMVNPRLCEMLGRSADELVGSSVLEITFSEDVAQSQSGLAEMASGRLARVRFEKRYVRPNGDIFWVAIHSAVLCDANGRPDSIIATFEDISLRKNALALLEERLERYNSVLATTQQGFWMVDLQGNILEVNNAYCELSGYSQKELLAMQVSQLDAIDSPQDVDRRMGMLMRDGSLQFETKHRRKDGSAVSMHVSASFSKPLGNRVFAFFTDLSKREADAQAIRSAHAELIALINSLPDAVIFKDGEGRWRIINSAAAKMLDLHHLAWRGCTDRELAAMRPSFKELHTAFSKSEAAVWKSREPQISHCVITDIEGNGRMLEIRRSPMMTAQGDRKSMLIIARDVTELEIALEQKHQSEASRKEIEKRVALAESAIAHVSEYTLRQIGQELHDDLGQMLSGAVMLADSIAHKLSHKDAAVAPELTQQLTNVLRDAVTRTRQISHDLYPADLQHHALRSMLQSLANHVSSTTAIQVRFIAQGDREIIEPQTALHLYRIVQEAVSNIVRHSKATEILMSVSHRHGRLRISVTDNGVGIDSHSTSRKGIGLQTMRSRAGAIGASFSVIGLKRGGTRVAVSLPLKPRS